MTPDLAVRLAQYEYADAPPHVQMQRSNEIFEANTDGHGGLPPFAKVDIVFATYLDHLKETGTQRERDWVYASEKLCRVWKTLHISRQVLGEMPTAFDREELAGLAPALHRLGLLHLLTENLSPALCQEVEAAAVG